MSALAIPGQLNIAVEQHDYPFADRESFQLQHPGAIKIVRLGGTTKRLQIATAIAAALVTRGEARPSAKDCFLIAADLIAEEKRLEAEELAAQQTAAALPAAEESSPGGIVLP